MKQITKTNQCTPDRALFYSMKLILNKAGKVIGVGKLELARWDDPVC